MSDTTPNAAPAAPAGPVSPSATLNAAAAPQQDGLGVAPPAGTPARGRWEMASALLERGTHTAPELLAMMAADEAVDEAGNASSEASAAQPEANAMDAAAYAAEASRTATGVLQELAHDPLDANTARFYGEALGRALANPPTYAQKVAQMRETEAHLKSTYGEANAAKMVADAMGEVEHLAATSLPKIREWLEESGGGNDPFLIARLAERAVARAKRQALKGIKR